jgi:AraC family transcriptional regulator
MRSLPEHGHQNRVHRAVNYITVNLHQSFELDQLAEVAGFSPFYFHRLFKSVTGEPVFHFIRRLRLERAGTLLQTHPDLPIRDIAHECGFDSQAVFARSFHEHFGRSAGEWRSGGFWWYNGQRWEWRVRKNSRLVKARRSPENWLGPRFKMLEQARNGKRWDCLGRIRVEEIRGFRMAYMRQLGPYDVERQLTLLSRFLGWVDSRGMITRKTTAVSFGGDNQNVVAPEHCRYDVGIVVDSSFKTDEALDVQYIPGGTYVVASFTGRLHEEPLATEYLWPYWIPHNGLQDNYGPVFRRFRLAEWKEQPLSPDTVFHYDLCIPVKPVGAPLIKPELIVEPFE